MRRLYWLLILLPILTFAQPVRQPDSGEIKLKLKKLNFLGSVLYMAAHPDDENTRVITYLAKDRLAATAYLSLTRGDGGQNLIGPEIRDLLGVIRTQELLAARRIDGGQQYFSRANDFGFSKSAEEAFRIWGKEEILSDAIKVFRMYQPDVVITRFPPDERAGHGHHTASAMLAHEAFDIAGKPDIYPELAKKFGTWQPKRLYTNTGRWWNREINEKSPGVITLDVGGYNTLLGQSYPEIAARSSSQHKSQGWGRAGDRGYLPEFLEFQKGEKAEKDIFEGVNTTWSRLKGGEKVQPLVEKAIQGYNPENPAASVPALIAIRKAIRGLEESPWKKRKLEETEQLIQDCLGLFIEPVASHFHGIKGEKIRTTLEVVNRSSMPVQLKKIIANGISWDTTMSLALNSNTKLQIKTNAPIKESIEYSEPYWLSNPHDVGRFTVKNPEYIGLPENPAAVTYSFTITVGDEPIEISKPLIFKWVDPVKGELWRPFEIVPPLFINLTEKVVVFSDQQPKDITVLITSAIAKNVSGKLQVNLPSGWRAEPLSAAFEFSKMGQEVYKTFRIFPSQAESKGVMKVVADVDGKNHDQALQLIQYDHIPVQTQLPESQANVVRINLKGEGKRIAYIRGAGDEIPAALRNIGYQVWEMKNEEVTASNLKQVDAVVLGIRALNTNERIAFIMPDLLNYVNEGGTLVVQYNNNFDLNTESFSPFPMKLGRDRVTEEDSEVRILKPEHPVLNFPNKITAKDFEGWVQERGLYYPATWDANFEAILSMNDKGETTKDGSLLVAKYGKGYYVYTGLSFFRQLPEGVAGAYKLFANLVSLHDQAKNETVKTRSKTK
jgi:LmbE family N-acetylglucosaminyl deacetylase